MKVIKIDPRSDTIDTGKDIYRKVSGDIWVNQGGEHFQLIGYSDPEYGIRYRFCGIQAPNPQAPPTKRLGIKEQRRLAKKEVSRMVSAVEKVVDKLHDHDGVQLDAILTELQNLKGNTNV